MRMMAINEDNSPNNDNNNANIMIKKNDIEKSIVYIITPKQRNQIAAGNPGIDT